MDTIYGTQQPYGVRYVVFSSNVCVTPLKMIYHEDITYLSIFS